MTKILVSVDMEGVSGVATRRETATGWPHGAGKGNDYEQARRWMTADANAAIAGAFEGGATGVLVADAHDGMLNLLWDELDPRAELIRGTRDVRVAWSKVSRKRATPCSSSATTRRRQTVAVS